MKHMASYLSPKSISQYIKPLQSYGTSFAYSPNFIGQFVQFL
jgi:hypothetical protein